MTMTAKELKKVPFRMVAHISGNKEHTCTYSSEDGRLGFCDYTPVLADFDGYKTFGRTRRHWRIDDKVYTSKAKFLAALKDFNQKKEDGE